jgi:methyl-accepting chemotaxis protein
MLKKLNNMQIRERLVKAFIFIAGSLAVIAAVGLITMIVVSNLYADALTNYGFAQGDVGQAMASFADARSAMRGVIGYEEQSSIDSMMEEHSKYKEDFINEFANIEKTMVTAANKQIYTQLQQELEEYWVLEQQILELGATEDQQKCIEAQDMAMSELMPMYNSIYDKLVEVMDIKVSKGNTLSTQLSVLCTILSIIIGIVIVCALFVAFRLGVGIANSISIPLNELKDRLATFAKGDLSSPFPEVSTKDEVADMIDVAGEMAGTLQFIIDDEKKILEAMAEANYAVTSQDSDRYAGDFEALLTSMRDLKWQMASTIKSIEEASSQVSAGSINLSEAAQSLAEGATDQAGAVEEMQATIMSITENIETAAESAKDSYQQAQRYSDEASRSRVEMKTMTLAMDRISEASQKIENIISEIEDIASQTNLLSLNASIEAARAGEAGRGFAVVADQIRQLAEQSSKAAVETRELIEGTIQEISEGSKAAERVAAVIETVVSGIGEIADSSKSVSSTAVDQAIAMKQAEEGVGQISEVVQSNSATAEESSATSQQLSAQALCLDELIGKFILPTE